MKDCKHKPMIREKYNMKDCKHKPMRDDCPVCLWKQGNTDKALRVAEEQIDDKIKSINDDKK